MQSNFTTNELIKMACSVKRIDHHLGEYHLNLYSIHQIIDVVRNTVMDEKASLAFGKEAVDWLRGHCDKRRKSQIMFCGQWLYSPQQMVLALCNAHMPHEYIVSKIDQKQAQIMGRKGHLVQILSVNVNNYFMPIEWCLRLICEWRYYEASLAEFQARCVNLV